MRGQRCSLGEEGTPQTPAMFPLGTAGLYVGSFGVRFGPHPALASPAAREGAGPLPTHTLPFAFFPTHLNLTKVHAQPLLSFLTATQATATKGRSHTGRGCRWSAGPRGRFWTEELAHPCCEPPTLRKRGLQKHSCPLSRPQTDKATHTDLDTHT